MTRPPFIEARARRGRGTATVFLIALAVGAALLGRSSYEAWTQSRALDGLLRAEGGALVEAVGHAVEDALLAGREIDELILARLLDQARLVGRLDEAAPLRQAAVQELALELGLRGIVLFDERLRSEPESAAAPGSTPTELVRAYRAELEPLAVGLADELVLEPRAIGDAAGYRLAAAVRRPGGGAVLVVIEASDVLLFREMIGAPHLLQTVTGTGGVLYAALEDTDGSLLAGSGLPAGDGNHLEMTRPVEIGHGRVGRLRLGLSRDTVLAANRAAWRRTGVLALVLLGLALATAAAFAARRRARFLRGESARARAVTDALVEGMEDAVVVLDLEHVIRLVNPAAAKLFERPIDELVGRRCDETPCARLARAALGEPPWIRELEFARANGRSTPMLASVSAVRDAAGETVGRAMVLRDLTRIRDLEVQTRRAEGLSALGRLAAAVAHEVRNPLNSIAVGVQRLQREFRPASGTQDYDRLMQIVRAEVERLDGIVHRFLDFARAPRLDPAPGDLDEVVRETVPLLAQSAAGDVRIVARPALGEEAVFDPNGLKQVLINLVRNAVEAVGPRGNVTIRTRAEHGHAVLEVTDDGPGIPMEDRERLFEYGFTTKPTGTGMGLAVVQRLVTEMGGDVGVDSTPGRGSTFRVRLPLAAETLLRSAR